MYTKKMTYNSNRCYHKKLIYSKRNKKPTALNTSNNKNYSNIKNSNNNYIKNSSNFNNNSNYPNAETIGYMNCTYNFIGDTFTFRNPETIDSTINKEDEIIFKPKKTSLKKLDNNNNKHFSVKSMNLPSYYIPKKAKALVINKVTTVKSKNSLDYKNYISSIIFIQKYIKGFISRKLLNKNKDKDKNNCNKFFNTVTHKTLLRKKDSKEVILKRCSLKEQTNIIYNKLNAIENNEEKSIITKHDKKDSKITNSFLDESEYFIIKDETAPIGIISSDLNKFNFQFENCEKFDNFENVKQSAKIFEKDECNKSIDEKSSFYDENEFTIISYDYNKNNNKTTKDNYILKGFDLLKTNKYIIFCEKIKKFILNRVFRKFQNIFKNINSDRNFTDNDNDDKTICDNCSTISSGRVLVNGDIYDKARTDLIISNNNICNNSLVVNQYKKIDTSDINTLNSFIINTGN